MIKRGIDCTIWTQPAGQQLIQLDIDEWDRLLTNSVPKRRQL
jgi:hypothetical protein